MRRFWIAAGVGAIAALGLAAAAAAHAAAPEQRAQATPKGWSYQLDGKGNRIPKGKKVTNPDGSWREEIPNGKCKTIKEMSSKGEYRETHDCSPAA